MGHNLQLCDSVISKYSSSFIYLFGANPSLCNPFVPSLTLRKGSALLLPCPPTLVRSFFKRGRARPLEEGSCSAAPIFKTFCFGHGMFSRLFFSHPQRRSPESLLVDPTDLRHPGSCQVVLECTEVGTFAYKCKY